MEESTMNNIEVDVKEIMKELKQQAKAKKQEDVLNFDEMGISVSKESLQYVEPYNRDEFIRELTEVNAHFWIDSEVSLGAESGLKKKIKKVIKKLIGFIIVPLVNKQNEYNIASVRAFNQIRNYMLTHDNVDKKVEELQGILEKEVLKSMELYSANYIKMAAQYESVQHALKVCEKKAEEDKYTIAILEKKIELMEEQIKKCN